MPTTKLSPSHSYSNCASSPRRRISSAYAQSHRHLKGSAGRHDSETCRAEPRGPEQPSSMCPARTSSIDQRCGNVALGAVRSSPRKSGYLGVKVVRREGCTDGPCQWCGECCCLSHRAHDRLSLLPLIKINSLKTTIGIDNSLLTSYTTQKVSYYLSGCL